MADRPIEDRTAPVATGAVNLWFIAPAMLLFGGFVLLPVGSAFYYAFTHWDGFTPPRWAGLANFQRAFADTVHLMSYVHVVLYILGTLVFEVAFGLLVAVLLNSDRQGFALLRGFFFSPVVLSMTAAGVLWAFVLDYRSGLLNSVLRALGRGRPGAAVAQPAGDGADRHHDRLGLEVFRLLHGDLLCRAAAHPAQHLRGGDARWGRAGAAVLLDHAAAAAPERAGRGAARHHRRVCRVRPVLHHDQWRAVRRHRSAGDLDHEAGVRPEPAELRHRAHGGAGGGGDG